LVSVGRRQILILSIDTTAGTSAAVFDGGQLCSLIDFADPFGHAENIGLAISRAIAEAGATQADIEGVIVGRGPASYTGLRVGIAAAKTLATALAVPLRGVMVLDAIAHGTSGSVLVTSDAKRRELFGATYSEGRRLDGPFLTTLEGIAEYSDFNHIRGASNASLNAAFALASGDDLSLSGAIYLRSPDVTPSKGKRVSG
jgi:tRNA threonylcarbamoyl adenosine modification protein YeaZ